MYNNRIEDIITEAILNNTEITVIFKSKAKEIFETTCSHWVEPEDKTKHSLEFWGLVYDDSQEIFQSFMKDWLVIYFKKNFTCIGDIEFSDFSRRGYLFRDIIYEVIDSVDLSGIYFMSDIFEDFIEKKESN